MSIRVMTPRKREDLWMSVKKTLFQIQMTHMISLVEEKLLKAEVSLVPFVSPVFSPRAAL